MSNYTKSTNFATKDALPSGDPLKIVKGTEIDTEFNNIATAVATKADSLSPTFTGTPAAPTATPGTNNTQLATTAYADAAVTAERTATATLTNKSLTSPTLTGTPVAPTAAVNTNTTQVATTAFVVAQIADDAPTKTGTGASGTWGIDITGSAAAATTATTATALSTASGSAPSYSARAWVNFNGTGTVAIRASGNVSSITDNGTGDYTVNFSTAMPDANYSVVGAARRSASNEDFGFALKTGGIQSTTAVQVCSKPTSNTPLEDGQTVCVAIHR